MSPDNEKIIATLAAARNNFRRTLTELIASHATPHTLSCVVEAMSTLDRALINPNVEYGYGPRLVAANEASRPSLHGDASERLAVLEKEVDRLKEELGKQDE